MKKLSILLILLATSVCYAQNTISNHIDVNNSRDTRSSVTYDFENGTMNPWIVIDADGDGYCWLLASEEISNAYGHNGSSDFVLSASYKNYVGVLYPDNYLVSPQIQLGGYVSFWACANDIYYAAEHFGVAVSTTGTNPNNFITIQEWTMTAKSEDNPDNPTRSGNRTQGVWYHYLVDLSYYAGQTGYIAIRHFNCSDMWYLDVDDITISQLYDFEEGTLQGWTVSSSDNGSTTWAVGQNGYNPSGSSNYFYTTHNGNYYVGSVYDVSNAVDDWLISPRFMLGGSMSFYIKSTNATNYTDYYSVYLSTGTNNINQFTTTLVPSTQVTSSDYTLVSIDLSNYSGQGYVAIRHTAAADQASLLVDDISFSASSYGLPWNLMATFNAAEAAQYGVATDGQHIYTSDWGYSGSSYDFYKYDMNGNLIEGFNISGCSNIMDLTYDGQYFYGGNSGNMLYCINLAQKVLVSSTNTSATIRHCSYDPINNGFWVGGWDDLKLINRSGQVLINAPNPYGCAGSGYYTTENGTAHLLLNCQLEGTVAGVCDYNIATNTIVSNPIFDLAVTPGYNGGIAGGAFVSEYNGKIAFFGDIQQNPNLIGIYELSGQLYNYYTITASASPTNGGSVYGSGTYAQGSTCPLSAVANNGYSFTNWTENDNVVSTNANYTFTVTGNRTLVAHFTQQHTINVSANPTNGGSVSGGGTYNHGQSCTVHATANSGYTFTNWTENGSVVSTNANYTFTVNNNRTLVANFTVLPPNTYNINVSANPSTGGLVSGGGSYQQGQNCTIIATANTGYTFLRWTENGTQVSTNASYTFTVTGNRTLVAQFQANTYTISVSANPTNGGTVTGGGAYQYGQSCTVTATANTGYTFLRWTENGNTVQGAGASYTFTVTGNRTLVAQFQQSTTYYNINATPSPSNAGTITGAGSYASGSTCILTAYPNNGYSFVNWLENGVPVSTNTTYSFTVTGNRNLVAVFDIETTYYTITVTANPSNGGNVTGGGSYASGTTITLHATPSYGYSFVKWTKNGTQVSTNPNYSFTVNSDASFVAYFEQNATNYTITVSAEPTNGGMVFGGGSYASGTTCTIDATANDGYSFIEWTNNGTWVSSNPNYSFMVTGNASYVAHFGQNINNYVINVNIEPSDGGTVSGGGTYAEGATCILTASPNTDYIFEKWIENGTMVSTNPVHEFTVTENHSFTAHFTRSANHYTVTAIAIPANGGTVLGGGTYEQGATCTLTASANNGFSFVNWTDTAGTELSADPIYSFTVVSNMICLANFKPSADTYSITASAEPLDGGTITGEGTYEAEATCTLIAMPNPTYSFVSWTENGIVVSTDGHYAFTVDRDRSLVAVFSQGQFYTISATSGDNGTISPEGEVVVMPGEDKTFAMIPNSGCSVKKVLVDGMDVGAVESYTFRNVNGNHSIHVEFSGLGLEDNIGLELKIYPNPANDKIHIESPNMKRVSIFNLFGIQIESKEIDDDYTFVNTNGFSQGTYILKVENNDGRIGYSRFVVGK